MGTLNKILFLNPPTGLFRRDDRCQSKVEEQTVRIIFPPMDFAYCAAVARDHGFEVKIGDYPAMGALKDSRLTGWDLFRDDLRTFRPDAILLDTTTATIDVDMEACRVAKTERATIMTIAKGEYLSAFGEKVIDDYPELDVAVFGEPEMTVLELMKKGSPEGVAGTVFRDASGEAIRNKPRELLADLDSLPYPARDLLDNALYRSPETGNMLTIIHANRGCPYGCIFCPAGVISNFRVRFRSPGNIIGELTECVERYGIREFLFHGDTFTMKRSWVFELCEGIRDADLDIRWGCNSRVDSIDEEMARRLRAAGCWVVAFGVESGSQEMLDRMKKQTKVDQAKDAIAACKKAGLRTHAFYVIGLPWETKETLNQTFDLAKELDTDFFDFNIAYPLPGTELYDIATREHLFVENGDRDNLSEASYAKSAVRTHELSAEYLTKWRQKSLLSLYLRPGYIWRMLKRAQSGKVRANYIRAGWQRLKSLVRI